LTSRRSPAFLIIATLLLAVALNVLMVMMVSAQMDMQGVVSSLSSNSTHSIAPGNSGPVAGNDGQRNTIFQADPPPVLNSFNPPANALNVSRSSTVALTYSAPMSSTTVTRDTVAVHSMMRGLVTMSHSTSGEVVTVTPNRTFFPGELIFTTATTDMTDITGTHPINPSVWQFNATVSGGHGYLPGETSFGTGSDATYCVAWGDYDNDGDLDLAVGNNGQNVIYRNSGGSFGSTVNFGTGSDATQSVAWGDYDNDGDLDLAVGNNGQNVVYPNNGGSFGSAVNFGTGSDDTLSVAWGDFDGDGDLDLAVGNDGQQNAVYPNNGGSFGGAANFGSGSDVTHSVAWGDLTETAIWTSPWATMGRIPFAPTPAAHFGTPL